MATHDELNEVMAIIGRIGPIILSSAVKPSGNIGSALRRAVGMLMADPNMVHPATLAYAFNVCLDLARHSEATLVTMDRVRRAALAENPVTLPAVLSVQIMVRMTLATEARIIAYMTFRSREQVDEVAKNINAAFSEASEVAADELDSGTYQALIAMHGDVIKHLAERGRRLPRIIAYNYASIMPALRMSHRAYKTGTRYQELINENRVVHPAFMPKAGKMLAI